MKDNDFEKIYDNYTQIMLFSSSYKIKLENMQEEVDEIQKAYAEIIETPENTAINSLEALKSKLIEMNEEINTILYHYKEIDDILHKVDVMIADYYDLEIQIDLYELNGMENDLLDTKKENENYLNLKSSIDLLDQKISERISNLKH